MPNAKIIGMGHYVPPRVVTNQDLTQWMATSDEWIQQRTGIKERHYVDEGVGTSDLAHEATKRALADAGLEPTQLDFIILATLSPDYNFPGSGCLLQDKLGVGPIGAMDVHNQCSGFLYALSVGTQFIKTGEYRTILVVGAEVQSTGIDFSDRGRDVGVIFGDGAGAVILAATDEPDRGVLGTCLHAEGQYAKELWVEAPASLYHPRLTPQMVAEGRHYPKMNGKYVFKFAVALMPAAIREALARTPYQVSDVDLFIFHQANLRISEAVAEVLGVPPQKIFNNIQRYGNTTAASIPLCLSEAKQLGVLKEGQLVATAAFGSGFTWASAVIRI